MYQNIIVDKSFQFSIGIVKLYKYLVEQKKEYILSKQLLRSGTSIGANVKEGIKSISKAEFKCKMSIALKEANETEYWIELMSATDILNKEAAKPLLDDCKELCRILNSIVKTCNK